MSGTNTTQKISSTSQTGLGPSDEAEEAPVRWPSVATSGGAAYVSHPQPTGAAGSETGAEG